ncbi:putative ac transposase [Quercus suber]|uniref:Ac transposase n=1 Tax=Quercus suber TaxID=58331 RepID=A0AAW0JNW9_QUESU
MSRPSRGDHDYLITAAEGRKLLNVTSEPRNWLKFIFAFKTSCSTTTTSSSSNSITRVGVGCSFSFPEAGVVAEVVVDLGAKEAELELGGIAVVLRATRRAGVRLCISSCGVESLTPNFNTEGSSDISQLGSQDLGSLMQPVQPSLFQHLYPQVVSVEAWFAQWLRPIVFQISSKKFATPRPVFRTLLGLPQRFCALFRPQLERSGLDLVRMIFKHGYPLNMVEHEDFKIFVKNLQPTFKLPSQDILKEKILRVNREEKLKLRKQFDKLLSFSLILNFWTDCGKKNKYCSFTLQFIEDGQLMKQIIAIKTVEYKYTGKTLFEIVKGVLLEWNIDKNLATITVESSSANDQMVKILKSWLGDQGNYHPFREQIFHIPCITHLIYILVKDGLDKINYILHKIRKAIKYMSKTAIGKQKFEEAVKKLNLGGKDITSEGVRLRWDSTLFLLQIALEFYSSSKVDAQSSSYMDLSVEEWDMAEVMHKCLTVFYDAICSFLGSKCHCTNVYFSKIFDIYGSLLQRPDSDIAEKMRRTFDKYFGRSTFVSAIAAVFDPRTNLEFVHYSFRDLCGDDTKKCRVIDDAISHIFGLYAKDLCSQGLSSSFPKNDNISSSYERSGLDLVRMIFKHGYPLNMVEHEDFKIFVKKLQPTFKLPSQDTLKEKILRVNREEKLKLRKQFDKLLSFSLILNFWTDCGKKNKYCSFTLQFIEDGPKLMKKNIAIKNVEYNYTGETLFEIVKGVLLEWNIVKKLASITLRGEIYIHRQSINISMVEWDKAEFMCKCLSVFYDAICSFFGSKCLSTNVYFSKIVETCGSLLRLRESDIAKKMGMTFAPYFDFCTLVPAMAAVFDPRTNLKFVHYCFRYLYGDCTKLPTVIDGALSHMFGLYAKDLCSQGLSSSFPNNDNSSSSYGDNPCNILESTSNKDNDHSIANPEPMLENPGSTSGPEPLQTGDTLHEFELVDEEMNVFKPYTEIEKIICNYIFNEDLDGRS